MPNDLTDELWLFRDEPVLDYYHLLAMWPSRVQGPARPMGVTLFGDIFFESEAGGVHCLDVIECEVRQVAQDPTDFRRCLVDSAWQDENLLAEVARLLFDRGHRPGPHECVGFAPHPLLAGSIIFDDAMVMEFGVWHTVCAALIGEATG